MKKSRKFKSRVTNSSGGSLYFFILVNDMTASKKTNLSLLPKTEGILVLKGSLWYAERIDSNKSSISLRSWEDDDTSLDCNQSYVSKLSKVELKLLVAISSCQERYTLYSEQYDKLRKAVKIFDDNRLSEFYVKVRVDCENSGNPVLGNLLSIREESGRLGLWFEINVGKNNLELGFQKYGKGIATPITHKLLVSLAQINEFIIDKPREPSYPHIVKKINKEAEEPLQLLKKGDRVVWISPEDVPEYGVVRWCGIIDLFPNQYTYGIEFDNPVGSGTGTFQGKTLFRAKIKHAAFVPAHGLIEAEVFGSHSGGVSRDKSCGDTNPDLSNKTISLDYSTLDSFSLLTPCSTNSSTQHSPNSKLLTCRGSSLSKEKSAQQINVNAPRFNFSHPVQKTYAETRGSRKGSSCMHLLNDDANDESGIGLGSLVQVDIPGLSKPQFGIVRWKGLIFNEMIVGIELEEQCLAATDGRFDDQQLFVCGPKRGYFAKLSKVIKDERFPMQNFGIIKCEEISELQSCPLADDDEHLIKILKRNVAKQRNLNARSLSTKEKDLQNVGLNLGIQGHHNSCYMDATLFSMFAFNHGFDSLLHRKKNDKDIFLYNKIQSILTRGIVNPLRCNFFVRADKMLKLRNLINNISSIQGFLCDEKDPEELLRCLFIETLKTEPFIKFSSGATEFLFQLLVDGHNAHVSTTQDLLRYSLQKLNLKFLESPRCLILQLPRSGNVKVLQTIVPSLFLHLEELIGRDFCYICGRGAAYQCVDCLKHFPENRQIVYFCKSCSKQVHTNPSRKNHMSRLIDGETLELFAVICIKTSHYVSFSKCGYQNDSPWVFFDSMADRIDFSGGYNVPKITPCQYIPKYLLDTQKFETSDILPEEVERFVCDGYICMYRDLKLLNYR